MSEAAVEETGPSVDESVAAIMADRDGTNGGDDGIQDDRPEVEPEGIADGEIASAEQEVQDVLDWATLVEEREGKKILRADKVPDNVLFGYGDTESDLFSRDDFDHRRSRYNQRMTEADKWIKERDRHYTEDGTSKGELFDSFNERFSSQPEEFLMELAESVPDKVSFSYNVLAKYTPDFAQLLRPAFSELLQSGKHNPAEFQAKHLQARVEQLQKKAEQEAQQRQIAENRARFETDVQNLAGGKLSDEDLAEVERLFVESFVKHQNLGQMYPDQYPAPTAESAYDAFVNARSAQPDPVEAVIEEATNKKETAPPRHVGGGGGGKTQQELTSDDLAAQLLAKRNQR